MPREDSFVLAASIAAICGLEGEDTHSQNPLFQEDVNRPQRNKGTIECGLGQRQGERRRLWDCCHGDAEAVRVSGALHLCQHNSVLTTVRRTMPLHTQEEDQCQHLSSGFITLNANLWGRSRGIGRIRFYSAYRAPLKHISECRLSMSLLERIIFHS